MADERLSEDEWVAVHTVCVKQGFYHDEHGNVSEATRSERLLYAMVERLRSTCDTLDRSMRESWASEKRLAAERDRLAHELHQMTRAAFWHGCAGGGGYGACVCGFPNFAQLDTRPISAGGP